MKLTKIASTLMILVLLLSISPAKPAYAAAIVVNTNADTIDANGGTCAGMVIGDLPGGDGVTSLREAICAANGSPGPDTITFAGNYTITLDGAQLPVITSEITITGNGAANTIIQAHTSANTATWRVFEVASGGNLSLNDLTVRHGRLTGSSSADGAGIKVVDGVLTMTDSLVTHNENEDDDGGGISAYDSTVTLTRVTVQENSTENSSNNGGGANFQGSSIVQINDSQFLDNYTGGGSANGGAIHSSNNNNVEITGSTFARNQTFGSSANGGGIFAYGGTLTIQDSTLQNNATNESNANGGGIYTSSGTVTIQDSTFQNNTTKGASANGGGISNYKSTLTVTNSTFFNNTAVGDGGAIRTRQTTDITNSTFHGNSSSARGGGIFDDGAVLNIINSTIAGNTGGNGLYVYDNNGNGPMTVKNSIIADNTGGDCIKDGGVTFNVDSYNIDSDGSCESATQKTVAQINLGSLANNGGSTQTMALLSGSHAIDAGDATTCASAPVNDKDQRGVTRSTYTSCDVGAFEYGYSPVVATFTCDGMNLTAEMTAGNYDGNTYVTNPEPNEHSNNLTNGSPSYTFPSSVYGAWTDIYIEDANEIQWFYEDVTCSAPVEPEPSTLPDTGFSQGLVTELPSQPRSMVYRNSGMILEIPSLGESIPILGVPQSGDSWDVTWLGNSAGYLYGSAFPTWEGNTVITGHVWDSNNNPGPFALIKDLQYGDQIEILAWGLTYTYEVRENRLLFPGSVDTAMELEEYDWVTLITCEFYNPITDSYIFRRLVKAVLVEISP